MGPFNAPVQAVLLCINGSTLSGSDKDSEHLCDEGATRYLKR